MTQGDVDHQTGLLRLYVSRVENGRWIPSLPLLERWAKGLDVELYQLFTAGDGQPEAPVLPERTPVGAQERTLLGLFGQMPVEDRALLISIARDLVKRTGKRG
jgi:transcriptional regulator with XRE-family HTH domain